MRYPRFSVPPNISFCKKHFVVRNAQLVSKLGTIHSRNSLFPDGVQTSSFYATFTHNRHTHTTRHFIIMFPWLVRTSDGRSCRKPRETVSHWNWAGPTCVMRAIGWKVSEKIRKQQKFLSVQVSTSCLNGKFQAESRSASLFFAPQVVHIDGESQVGLRAGCAVRRGGLRGFCAEGHTLAQTQGTLPRTNKEVFVTFSEGV